jgi:hypothetical protein
MRLTVLRDLSTEEKMKPYAKYFYIVTSPPPDELIEAHQKPMHHSKALQIENINDLLDPDLELESGYCTLPNGSYYHALRLDMSGVTSEMIDWWFNWHCLESLRLKLWWPWGHFYVAVSDEDKKRILDPKIPLSQKTHGVTHYVIEDLSSPFGPEKIHLDSLNWMSPEKFGFDMNRFRRPNVATWIGGVIRDPFRPTFNERHALISHFVREIPGGIQLTLQFWSGYTIENKEPKLLLPPGFKGFAFAVSHGLWEFDRLGKILPDLYKEQEGKIP